MLTHTECRSRIGYHLPVYITRYRLIKRAVNVELEVLAGIVYPHKIKVKGINKATRIICQNQVAGPCVFTPQGRK